MLNIITYDGTNPKEFMKYRERGYIDLASTQTIEDRFNSLFNKMLWKEDEGWWDGPGPRFDDPFDIAIMKEIDCAERCDLLVVKTHIGTAPLTCLSTGCKFGLLVNYWTKEGCKIVASWDSAGKNVFEFLGRELDITLYMDKRSFGQYFVSTNLKNVLIDGKEISEVDEDDIKEELCIVTPEKLKIAHRMEHYDKYEVKIPLSMKYDYLGMHELLGESCTSTFLDYVEDEPFLKEYHYIFKTTEINVDLQIKYPVLWIFRKENDSYKFTLDTLYKYPNFIDMLCEIEYIYRADTNLEEIFMVVFDAQCAVFVDHNYPKYIAYGLVCTPEKKEMSVIGVRETVEKLADMAEHSIIDTERECPRKQD